VMPLRARSSLRRRGAGIGAVGPAGRRRKHKSERPKGKVVVSKWCVGVEQQTSVSQIVVTQVQRAAFTKWILWHKLVNRPNRRICSK